MCFFFAGGALESPFRDEAKQNVIYDLFNKDKLDGLIICPGLLMNYIGLDKFMKFIEPYRDIPMVSIGIDIKGIPSVVFDNRECMHVMVNHLIDYHDYSKIAFIKGTSLNPEAVMRFEGYKDALIEHKISFDEDLILQGDFHELSPDKTVEELMGDSSKRPQAIVAANDEMAIQAFYRLKQMGIEVGKDVALTGFDNIETIRSLSPSFTTVEQPISQMASEAAKLIDLVIDGQPAQHCTYLTGRLIVRESCGCYSIIRNKKSVTVKGYFRENTLYYTECEKLENYLIKEKSNVEDLVLRELNAPKGDILEYKVSIFNLINALVRDIKARKTEGEFIEGVKELLYNSILVKNLDYAWNETLYAVRSFVLSDINNYEVLSIADEIFYIASVLIGNIINKRESIKHFNFKRMYIGTRDLMRKFNFIPNFEELTKVIRTGMSWYGIKQCYLCIYDTPVTSMSGPNYRLHSKAKLMLGYNEGKLTESKYLDTLEILPQEIIHQEKRNDLIFFPLVTGEDYFGYIAWDMNAVDEFVYETFREQISNTLEIQLLFNERIKAEEQLNLAVMELEKRNGELKNRYVIDELTGIFNRRGFYMHGGSLYKSAVLTGGKAIICFADMDGLKKINDTYGHKEGDEAILAAALLIKESFGENDIVARIGGDEFTIITANKSSINEINQISQQIYSCFERYNHLSKKPYKLTISLGFSVYSQDSMLSLDELIQNADRQLYKQKKKKEHSMAGSIG
jgi:diguanylate cyclase (GGDEF)-like protein